jgi:hypothetical protein
MRFVNLAAPLFAALLCLSAAAGEQAPERAAAPPVPDRVAELITALGSEEFRIRESASEELAHIGLPAFSALEAAALHPDREVRYRSLRVLGLIRQHDMQRRLEAFLQGKDGADEYPLPGWTRFRKSYGDDPPARTLFVDIQRADPELMKALEGGPRPATDILNERIQQHQQMLQQGIQQLSLGQIAGALFVAAEQDVSLPPQTAVMVLNNCYQPAFRDAVNSRVRREIPRKMLGMVIRRSNEAIAYQAMSVAYQYNMPEGAIPAEKILTAQPAGRSPHMTQSALMTVARLGDASQLPLVEKLLGDKTRITSLQEDKITYDVQIRDAALAAAVMLTKQDLKTYFAVPASQQLSDPQLIFLDARVIGFASEEKRAAVFAKWAQYKASNAVGERGASGP